MARSARASFEEIAESIPHIVWLADPDGSTDYFNDRGTDYTGLERTFNYGWQWVRLIHPDDAERARAGWEHATRTTTPFELSYRIRRRDGAYRWHACKALPVRGGSGEVLRWIGTADDIDATPRALDDGARRQRQVEQLRSMLAATPAPAPTLEPEPVASAVELAPRELAVLRLVAVGHTNAEIAGLLGLSLRTIESSRARLRTDLGLRRRADFVRAAHERGLGV
jgi:PAS domain S-box-containing protein